MSKTFKRIAPFLSNGQNKTSKLLSYIGLGIGVFLLLSSLQLYVDLNQLMKDKDPRKDGFDFISITRAITNQNMGGSNRFSSADIREMKAQPFIDDAAPLIGNQFRVKASAGNLIPFSTDLFLESIQTDFLDTVPTGFTWQPGQTSIPIIFSADFLEMYNVFAPAYELPALSASTAGMINVNLECYGPNGIQLFTGHIVGFSDRINSVLVPVNFLEWANRAFGNTVDAPAGRVFLKTTDANSTALLHYLQQNNFHVNKDRTKFGRVKQVLQTVVSGVGFFAVLVILLAMMLFSFYLQLMIARSKDNLLLLLTLGYSPKWLSKTVAQTWVAGYTIVIFSALLLTGLVQYLFQDVSLNGRDELSPYLNIWVVILAILLWCFCIFINYRMIKKLLSRL